MRFTRSVFADLSFALARSVFVAGFVAPGTCAVGAGAAVSGAGVAVGVGSTVPPTSTGTLTERVRPRHRRKAFSVSLRRVRVRLPAGEAKVVRLQLSRLQVKRLRRALKRRRGLTATLQLVATADVGDPTTVSRRLPATG